MSTIILLNKQPVTVIFCLEPKLICYSVILSYRIVSATSSTFHTKRMILCRSFMRTVVTTNVIKQIFLEWM
jgi:hypothetical protein